MTRRFPIWLPAAVALAAAVALSACSNDGDSEDDIASPEPGASAPAEENVAAGGETPAADAGAEEPALNSDTPIVEIYELNDWYRAVSLNEQAVADPEDLEALGREICEGLAPCRAAMWYDASLTPTAFPVAEEVLREQVFAFGRTTDGAENILWNCNFFPQFETDRRCLPRPMD